MGTGAACVVYALFHKIKPLARRRTRALATHGRSPYGLCPARAAPPAPAAPNLCFHAGAA